MSLESNLESESKSELRLKSELDTEMQENLKKCRDTLEKMPNSREKSLVMTKLDEAEMWFLAGILAEKLSVMSFDGAEALFTNSDRIKFSELGRQKTAVFLRVSDTDRSMDRLISLFFTQALHTLCNCADTDNPSGRLQTPVRFIFDDFAANTYIPDFDKIISSVRSRNISVSVILQSISQLEGIYGHAGAVTIINNCDNLLYLGGTDAGTARYFSIKANKSIHTILNMPLSDAWLFTRGSSPKSVRKYNLKEHEKYHRLPEYSDIGVKVDKCNAKSS